MKVISAVQCSQLSPNSNVFYISQQYSSVFVIDMTPSMIQVVRKWMDKWMNGWINGWMDR